MKSDSQFLKSILSDAPDLAPGEDGLSFLMQVDGSALFHEEATLLIDPDADTDLLQSIADAEGGEEISGVLEIQYPASAILGWQLPDKLPQLLSALGHEPSTWTVASQPGFAGQIEVTLLQRPENASKGEQFVLVRDRAGTYREIDPELAEILESSGDEDQVGYRIGSVFRPTLAWKDRENLQHVTLDQYFAWECELLLRLAAACGFPVPDRLNSGFSIPSESLLAIRDAAARCLSRVVRIVERQSRQPRLSSRIERACSDAMRLDRLAGRPDPRASITLLQIRGEAREARERTALALEDAKRLFRLARDTGNHEEAASAAMSAYHLDQDDRSTTWARRACREAAAAGAVENWALAKQLLGDSLQRQERCADAIREYEHSLRGLRHLADSPRWRMARVKQELAACWKELGDAAQQTAAERDCFDLYGQDSRWQDASRAARRLAESSGSEGSGEFQSTWIIRAIEAAERSGDGEVLAEAHDTASSLHSRSGRSEEMIRHAELAIVSYQTMPKPPYEKIAWLHERIAESESPADRALLRMHSELAVVAFDRAGTPSKACDALGRLFRLAWTESRWEDSLRFALDASGRAHSPFDRLRTLSILGCAQANLKRHSEARSTFESASDVARRCRSSFPTLTARYHRWFAAALRDSDDLELATREEISHFECLQMTQDWKEAAKSALRIAQDADSLVDPDLALEWYATAVPLGMRSGDDHTHAEALELLGHALRDADRPNEAIARYRKAISVLDASEDASAERLGRIRREIMRCEQELGRLGTAARTGTSAIEDFLTDECWCDAAETADGLADIALEQGDEAGRRRWHERTLEFARRCESMGDLALAHEWIGDTLQSHDRPKDAIPSYLESLRILESWPESTPSRIARVHGELARCHATLGDFTAARESALAALKAHSDAEEPEEALDLVESLDPAFLADPTARAVKAQAIRLAEESDNEDLVRRAADLESG